MKSSVSAIENVLEQVVKSISSKSTKNNKKIFKQIMESHQPAAHPSSAAIEGSSDASTAISVLSKTNMRLKRPISGYHLFLRKNIQESTKSARQASFLFDHAAQRWRALSVSEKLLFMRQAEYLNKVNGFSSSSSSSSSLKTAKSSVSGSTGINGSAGWNADLSDLDREAEAVTLELKSYIEGSNTSYNVDPSSLVPDEKSALSSESLLLGSDRRISGYNIYFKENYSRLYKQYRTQVASIKAMAAEWNSLPVNEKVRYTDTACRINSIKEWLASNTLDVSSSQVSDASSQRTKNWNMSALKDSGKTVVGYDCFMRLFYPALRERYSLLTHRGTLDRLSVIWRLMSSKQRKIFMSTEPRLLASFDFVFPSGDLNVSNRRPSIIQPYSYNAFYSFVLSKYSAVLKDKPQWTHQEIMKNLASVWNTSLSPVDRQLFIDDFITKNAIKNLIVEASPHFDTGFGSVKYVADWNKPTEDVFEFIKEEEYKCINNLDIKDGDKRYRRISDAFTTLVETSRLITGSGLDLDSSIENLLKIRPTDNSFQLYIKELAEQSAEGTESSGSPLPQDVFLRNADVAEKWRTMEPEEKEVYLRKFQDLRSLFRIVTNDFLADLMSSLFLVVVDKADSNIVNIPSEHFVKQLEEFSDKYGSEDESESSRLAAKTKFMNEHVVSDKFEQNLRKIWARKPYNERRAYYDKYGVKMAVYEYIRQVQSKLRNAIETNNLSEIEKSQEYTDLERKWQHLTHVQKTFYSKWDFNKAKAIDNLQQQKEDGNMPKEYNILRNAIPDIALKAELQPSDASSAKSDVKIVKLGISAYSSVYRQFFHQKLAEEQQKYHKVVKFLVKNASSTTSNVDDRSMTKLKDQELFSDALKRYAGGWKIASVCEHIHRQWLNIHTDLDGQQDKIQSID